MKYDLDRFRGDVFGGVTSMVVAVPVALGFGIASGMGAAAGLYGAIIVGFFASAFGGTRTQISGPTAPMTVAMAVVLTSYADTLAEALTVVVLSGLLQVLLGLSRVGRLVAYTPYMVVSGFMSGIGVIIVLMQTLPFLGASGETGGPMGALRVLPEALGNVDTSAFAIAALTLAVGFLWPRRFTRFAPGPLVALLAGTALGVLWLSDAPVIGRVPTGLPTLQLELPSADFLLRALEPAVVLALLGSVDSLLTSLVADSLTGRRHNPDRELVGQGIANLVAGLFGALPGAGATMGTVTNIRSGGSSPVSGVVRAALLLALVLGLGGLVEPIPLGVLAGVLMKVGWDIIDWRVLTRIHRLPLDHLLVMLTTLSLTVFVDLITCRGDRTDRRRDGACPTAGTPGTRQRGLGAAPRDDLLRRARGARARGPACGTGRHGRAQGDTERRLVAQTRQRDRSGHQGARRRHLRLLRHHLCRRQRRPHDRATARHRRQVRDRMRRDGALRRSGSDAAEPRRVGAGAPEPDRSHVGRGAPGRAGGSQAQCPLRARGAELRSSMTGR